MRQRTAGQLTQVCCLVAGPFPALLAVAMVVAVMILWYVFVCESGSRVSIESDRSIEQPAVASSIRRRRAAPRDDDVSRLYVCNEGTLMYENENENESLRTDRLCIRFKNSNFRSRPILPLSANRRSPIGGALGAQRAGRYVYLSIRP